MLSDTEVSAAGDYVVPGFREEIVFSGLDHPTVVEFAADGRVFVAEKRGDIKVFDSLADPTPATWANIRPNVHDFWDRGLLGMALDPDFLTNGRIYVAYAHNLGNPVTGVRWPDGSCPNPPGATGDGCVVNGRLSVLTGGSQEEVLVEDWCQQYPSHSMSDIVFDLEGALIVNGGDGANFDDADYGQWGGQQPATPIPVNPCGDPPGGVGGPMVIPTAEGGALRSQDIRSGGDPTGLGGAVIRVDPETGDPMPDNPTTSGSDNERRIIAYGLRNPFRLAVHPDSGELWIGDVGWGTFEEINRHSDPDGAVRNYGWPCREGAGFQPTTYPQLALCQSLGSAWLAPHLPYQHGSPVVAGDGCQNGSSAISGLAFYDGGDYPDIYDGGLFFTDYARKCLWVMRAGAGGVPSAALVSHVGEVANPVHLTVGPGGDLFYVDFGPAVGGGTGSVRRIVYSDNEAPTAVVSADPVTGQLPLSVDFDASGSTDPEDDALSFAWDFGDNDDLFNDATGPEPSHTYTDPGSFTARVRVTDTAGGTDIAQVVVNAANAAPTAVIDTPSPSLAWSVGQRITFGGHGTDANQATIPASAMTWDLVMAHCPASCHEHVIGTFPGVAGGNFDAPDHEYPSHLVLRLTVDDAHGASDSAEVVLQPKTVTLRIRSTPSGLSVDAGWMSDTTPFDLTVIAGSAIQLNASAGGVVDGFPYTWQSWSNGGSAVQVVTPTASTTLTASYTGGFDDVPPGAKFRSDIAWLLTEGITAGCSDSPPLYCPNGLVTRGQMATFLSRALDLPSTSTDFFGDDESNVHEASINRLRAAGITSGCAPGRYCPDGRVTRAQMATFLSRALDLVSTSTDFFGDDETNKHEASINRLAAAGITSGCGPGRFCPDGIVTRGQMAAFLHRGLGE